MGWDGTGWHTRDGMGGHAWGEVGWGGVGWEEEGWGEKRVKVPCHVCLVGEESGSGWGDVGEMGLSRY